MARIHLGFVGIVTLAASILGYGAASLLPAARPLQPAVDVLRAKMAEQRRLALRAFRADELRDEEIWRDLPGRSQICLTLAAGEHQPGRGRRQPQAAAPPVATGLSTYERLYGSAQRYQDAAHRPLTAVSGAGGDDVQSERGAKTNGAKVRGVVLSARLKNEVVSHPPGATVIAEITRTAQLGKDRLPPGSQVHGAVKRSNVAGERIEVAFEFARLPDGRTLGLTAVATDPRGRPGIPARARFDGGAAGNVGLAAASRASSAAGHLLAGSLGSILGAGVEGAMAGGKDVAGQYTSAAEGLVAERGTAMQIYVQTCCN